MKIVKYPDKRLHERSKEVKIIDFLLLRRAIPKLIIFMQNNNGCGLAGVQVGIMQRFFIMKYAGTFHTIYNPKIIKYSHNYLENGERCLSLPGKTIVKMRARMINVTYQNKDFKKVHDRLSGIDAIIFQHEYDHLDGILIND